ncbi:RIP metalloprotease RseP [Herminiimonas sp. CN]|uniref:RIP metalloprotease RseP n=1 Tax=Herminiimonas sp. CN TaxID=1349818 RepID=UPI0004737D4B|nr:RIP metalloprotease RseP [Herminiimonas sp. CN]
MNLLQTLIAFVFALGTLVIVHELGHFLVARLCGVKVLRFSVGMGKVVFSRRFGIDQTEWVISALPLGGYVKMLDAREQNLEEVPPQDRQREFTCQNVWKRIAIVAAGPVANFILAILLFATLYMHGIPEPVAKIRIVPEQSAAYKAGLRGGERVTAVNGEAIELWSDLRWKLVQLAVEKSSARLDVSRPDPAHSTGALLDTVTVPLDGLAPEDLEGDFLGQLGISLARPPAVLGKIVPDGPAMQGGLQEGDLILAVDGKPVVDGLAFIDMLRSSANKPLQITGRRAGREFTASVTPEGQMQGDRIVGRIKAEVAMIPAMVSVSAAPVEAIAKGAGRTWDTSVLSFKMLGKMLVGEVSLKNITGPITIADYAGQTARIGIVSYISFIAFISISLGVMNLLPIPVLDGGLLLYYFVEVLTGRPVSARFGEIAQRAGMGILMALMLVAVFNDIVRLIS